MRTLTLALALTLGIAAGSCGGDGSADTGASCIGGSDCKSGHCLEDPASGVRRCTGKCQTNSDCPPGAPSCANLGSSFPWTAGSLWCVYP